MNFHVHQVISRYLVFYVFRKIKIGPPGQLLICNARTKNVPWHILAPAAVACDIYLIRRSVHPRGAFLLYRKAISCKVKKGLSKRTVQIENAN